MKDGGSSSNGRFLLAPGRLGICSTLWLRACGLLCYGCDSMKFSGEIKKLYLHGFKIQNLAVFTSEPVSNRFSQFLRRIKDTYSHGAYKGCLDSDDHYYRFKLDEHSNQEENSSSSAYSIVMGRRLAPDMREEVR
jgi:hypothetical protein